MRCQASDAPGADELVPPELQAPAANCSPEDIFNLPLTEDYFVVDTRPAEAFAAAHLPTARSFPTLSTDATAAGLQLESHAAAWLNAELEQNEPEQKSRAVVLGDPAAKDNRNVLNVLASAITHHPRFQRPAGSHFSHGPGGLQSVLVLEEGHDAVAAKYPFLPGKEWKDLPTAYPSQVQPRLFLGSCSAAKSRQVFEHLGIGAVVNATRELPNYHEGDAVLCTSYLKLPLDDDPDQDLEAGIEQALPFIASHLQAERNVLVHCQMGQSRSVSIVVAHLMSTLGCGYGKALALVRSARPAARPNEGFQAELRSLEGRLIYGAKK